MSKIVLVMFIFVDVDMALSRVFMWRKKTLFSSIFLVPNVTPQNFKWTLTKKRIKLKRCCATYKVRQKALNPVVPSGGPTLLNLSFGDDLS